MAETTLEWKLESRNFDELKSELHESMQERIGDNHCKLCVLASGPMCIKRSVCRIFYNEVWINKEITEIKPIEYDFIIEYADVCNFMFEFCKNMEIKTKYPTKKVLKDAARKNFEERDIREDLETYLEHAYLDTKIDLKEFYIKNRKYL